MSTSEEFTDKDGNCKKFPHKRLLLIPNAMPTIFKELPKYLSPVTIPEQSDPAEHIKLLAERHENAVNDFISKDIISNFDDFMKSFQNYVNNPSWKFEVRQSDVIVYFIDFTEIPKVIISVKVDCNMNVTLFKNSFHVNVMNLKWLFNVYNGNIKLERWS